MNKVSRTDRVFHLHMIDTTIHILVLWYIIDYVEGQPKWFYVLMGGFLLLYLVLAILSVIGMLVPHYEK